MSDNKPWVKDSGHATESELAALVQKKPIDGCWAAFYTDRFAAGRTADGVPLSSRKTCWNCACSARRANSGSAGAA